MVEECSSSSSSSSEEDDGDDLNVSTTEPNVDDDDDEYSYNSDDDDDGEECFDEEEEEENNNDMSDYEYEYEEDEEETDCYGNITNSNNDTNEEEVILRTIEKDVENLNKTLKNEDCWASFCQPPLTAKLCHGDAFHGVIYLFFPIKGSSLESKVSMARFWGFDPEEHVVVRLNAWSHLFGCECCVPLTAGDLGVAVYQREEPSFSWVKKITTACELKDEKEEEEKKKKDKKKKDKKKKNKDKKNKDKKKEEGGRKENVEVLNVMKKVDFRLGDQIKRISEEFLLANMSGNGHKEGLMTLSKSKPAEKQKQAPPPDPTPMFEFPEAFPLVPDEESQKRICPHCTYHNDNLDGMNTNCSVCGGLLLLDSDFTESLKDFNNPDYQDAEWERLQTSRSTPPRPYSNKRDDMVEPFLEEARTSGHTSLLAQFYTFLRARLPQLHRFCVNCDHPHISLLGSGGNGGGGGTSAILEPIRPSVCQREFCSWAFMELGIGRTSTDELAFMAEVVDLLLAITTRAALSRRAEKILSPFPLVVNKQRKKVFDPKRPNYEKAKAVAEQLPSMQQIASSQGERHLEEICDCKGKHVYGLLQWIIASCPAQIVSLQGDHRLMSMGTDYQFFIRSASPEQEEFFNHARRRYKSTFAFHGSPIENWHSILRVGLKNCSGTSLQLNGASYGKGIYLSPSAQMSMGYSRVDEGYSSFSGTPPPPPPSSSSSTTPMTIDANKNNFISSQRVQIMALCEVIDDGNIKKSGSVWVVAEERHVVARFLFVFLPQSSGFSDTLQKARACNTDCKDFVDEVRTINRQIAGLGCY